MVNKIDDSLKDGWISVNDKLPENADDVLVTYQEKDDHSRKFVGISCFSEMYFNGRKTGYYHWMQPFQYFDYNHEIIAWMPLPKPYTEPNKE
jgi:hypothetical protein